MPRTAALSGWTLISLRPRQQHATLRRAASAQGARLLAISPQRLDALVAGDTLQSALQCPIRIASSPTAVRFAAAQQPLHGHWLAIGKTTAKALQCAGAESVTIADPQNAEGVLALPALTDCQGLHIGLITAPDGRGLLESSLPARGAQLHIAHVYRRRPLPLTARAHRCLHTLGAKTAVMVSSRAAFTEFWQQLDSVECDRIKAAVCIASSSRLRDYLQTLGIRNSHCAAGTTPAAMLAALREAVTLHAGKG